MWHAGFPSRGFAPWWSREEFGFEGIAEFVVFGLFFGANDVVGSEEPVGDGVLADASFGFRGARAGGSLGVDLVSYFPAQKSRSGRAGVKRGTDSSGKHRGPSGFSPHGAEGRVGL